MGATPYDRRERAHIKKWPEWPGAVSLGKQGDRAAIGNRQAPEGISLKRSDHGAYDAEIDGSVDPPSKKLLLWRVPWLLAGIALASVAWAAVAIYVFVRSQPPPFVNPPLSTDAVSGISRPPPSPSRPLFEEIPDWVSKEGIPTSEIRVARAVRKAEQQGREALWRAYSTADYQPSDSKKPDGESLKAYLRPCQKIDGWLMKVDWSVLREGNAWGSGRYDYTGFPPLYEMILRFPENLADFGVRVCLSGHNVDFQSKDCTCPNKKFESIKDGDWVRVVGVLRPESRVKLEPGKSDDVLSLGEVTIFDIQRVEGDQEASTDTDL